MSLTAIIEEAKSKLEAVSSTSDIENLRVHYLGKSGVVTEKLKSLGQLPAEERKAFGQEINKVKEEITDLISYKKELIARREISQKLQAEQIDITLPANQNYIGSIHPISKVITEIVEIFGSLGFKVAEGNEIEDDFHNFTALNIPESHPARQMHDTFYVKSDSAEKKFVLRTHTSPVQIRVMENNKPPLKFIAPGRTFRCDSDQTHSPMFHQVEGFMVDKNVDMAMLKGCLIQFVEEFFGIKNVKMRFRSSFFPFTEPSAEVDIGCSRKNGELKIGEGDDWLEILGCGMIHPNVLKNCGINPQEYQGFAFGMGIERLAMLKYGIPDLRKFFESDYKWLKHYGFKFYEI
ncbi:MAG: phenylalanine--tRNA ligase subunit alpha [Rickettsiales bacterium]|nr:phenylalanine--tRNA ligase subunit alpha [Rickettsiales bacterium]